jgi:hypothetical protein
MAETDSRQKRGLDDPREIAKWATRYARSRTIPFLVQWVFVILLVAPIGASSYLMVKAYYTGHVMWLWLCLGLLAATLLMVAWFALPRFGGDPVTRLSEWFYRKEGHASYSGGDDEERWRKSHMFHLLTAGLVIFHFLVALLVTYRYVPVLYMQPMSALYMSPFLAMMAWRQRLGFWAHLWPLLYFLHAVVVTTVYPFSFKGQVALLNIVVPVFGYGLISMIVGHFYSRFALYKLKSLARRGLDMSAFDETDDSA